MNPSPDDPSEFEVPLTRAAFGGNDEGVDDERGAIERTEVDPARTLGGHPAFGEDPESTDPALTRAPSPDMTDGSLSEWIKASAGQSTEHATTGGARRGIIGTIEPGQTLYAKYQVLRKLGGGAMGDVWLVRHSTLKSEHALKVIVPNFARNELALMRFQREFEVMATLRHEHAVTIYDACIDEDGGYIDMEYVDGLTLDSILASARSRTDRDFSQPLMTLEWIVRVLDQLCDVLQTAHEKGIVHRDLKPSNMMLLNGRKPGKEYLKVLDFGIAKVRDDPEGASGRELEASSYKTEGFIGTPSYGSPEQALAMTNVDGRADLYSVGIMLYEFVTGRLPFRGSPLQVMSQNANSPPPPFYESNPKLRSLPEVEHAILRVLSKDPAHRPANARELFDEFREAVVAVLPTDSPGLSSVNRDQSRSDSSLFFSPTTEEDRSVVPHGLLSTMEATLIRPEATVAKPSIVSASDLGPVLPEHPPAFPTRIVVLAVGGLLVALIAIGLVFTIRSKPVVTGVKAGLTSPAGSSGEPPRFADYWPANYIAVDSSGPTQVWPEKVRRKDDDRYFYRFADGIYLPEGYQPENPSDLVEGWPAVIVRDTVRFIRVEGNKEWVMGSWFAEVEQGRLDVPAHPVKLTGYYLQETEVTNGQYEDFLEKNQVVRPVEWERIYGDLSRALSRDLARRHPAVNLSRKQALAFARSIDAQLPTEAQWEFAARSRGEKRRYVWSDSAPPSRLKANIDRDDELTTAPVKSFPEDRTSQGVFDMLGNVQEFCRDVRQPYKKSLLPEIDPCFVPTDLSLAEYVVRGASFNAIADDCSLTRRDDACSETEISPKYGFRLVVECPEIAKPR